MRVRRRGRPLGRLTLLLVALVAVAALAPSPAAEAAPTGQQQSADKQQQPVDKQQQPQQYAGSYEAVYGTFKCFADAIVRPSSTQELAAALKQLVGGAKAPRGVKVRVSRAHFHGTATFNCPGAFAGGRGSPLGFVQPYAPSGLVPVAAFAAAGGSGSGSGGSSKPPARSEAAPTLVAVLLDGMKRVVSVDRAARRATVEAGLRVDELLAWAEASGFSLERGAPSTYAELTIGGVLATGGHGTGFNVTSNLADIVESFTWVDAAGAVHTSPRNSAEGRALSGGVGLLGVIAEVTLRLEAPSRTKAVSRTFLDDSNLLADIDAALKVSPWAAVIWRPDIKKYSSFNLLPAAASEPDAPLPNPSMTLVPSVPRAVLALIELFYLPWQADYQDVLLAKLLNPLNCIQQALTVAVQTWAGLGLVPLPVAVGSTNRIAAGGCRDGCAWQGGLSVDDIAFAIEKSDLADWVADIRRITRMDLQEDGCAPDRCMASGHYLLRFGRGNADFAGPWSGLKAPVMVELTTLRRRDLPDLPSKYGWVQDVVEQLTLCKYKGKPHWGKNSDRTYMHPRCPVRDNARDFAGLLAVRDRHDPDRVFEPPLMAAVAARAAAPLYPRCALDRACYCEADIHCGPGHRCVPSAAFPQFKACRPDDLKALLG